MRKLVAYPLSVLFLVFFVLTLLVFHPLQWLTFNLFGYEAHKRCVALMNLSLMRCTHILGTTYSFKNEHKLPTNRPLIIVANHQSLHDISPIIWFMRKHHPKFVSKKELGKGIPSVSYNLRHGGSALIDRKDSKQAFVEIGKLGKYIEKYNRSAVIFPEGTRSRNGHPKEFKTNGLRILMKRAPSALLVPISINNSWKMLRYGKFPYGIGNRLTFVVHAPMTFDKNFDQVLEKLEKTVVSGITEFK